MLLAVLSDYGNPRKKINSLKKNGLIKPIKQGVYLVSEDLGFRPYSKEILANLIYGPSYISLETALSNYGFIPERVAITTSISIGRGKSFSTPVGEFEYHNIKETIYFLGVKLKEISDGVFCQHATPEKALLDFIHTRETKGDFSNSKEYFEYLSNSYRFDLDAIKDQINLKKLESYSSHYPFKNVGWFADELIRKLLI